MFISLPNLARLFGTRTGTCRFRAECPCQNSAAFGYADGARRRKSGDGDNRPQALSKWNLLYEVGARAFARHEISRRAGPVLRAKARVAIHVIAEKTILWLLLSNALFSLGCIAHFFEHQRPVVTHLARYRVRHTTKLPSPTCELTVPALLALKW